VIDLFGDLARRGCVVVVATHDDEMMSACDVQYSLGRPVERVKN
jgi:putative ABC transport system ATP-binding protein